MKTVLSRWLFILLVACSGAAIDARAESVEHEVRDLDRREAEAVLAADYATLDQLWAEDFIVNNPFNKVARASTGVVRTGALTYSSFVREVEAVEVHGEVVVVMGKETVVPKGSSPDSGKTILRRYTHLWMKRDGKWRLTARHANVVCGG